MEVVNRMFAIALTISALIPHAQTMTRHGDRSTEGLLGSNMEYPAFEETNLDTVDRLNFGAHFTPERGSFTPEVATYNLLLVLKMPTLMQIVTNEDCEKDDDGKCIQEKICEKMRENSSVQDINEETSSANVTCGHISRLMTQLRASRVAISTKLLTAMTTELRAFRDQADTGRQKRDYYEPGVTAVESIGTLRQVVALLQRAATANNNINRMATMSKALGELLEVVPALAGHTTANSRFRMDHPFLIHGTLNTSLSEVERKLDDLKAVYSEACDVNARTHEQYICSQLDGVLSRFANTTTAIQQRYQRMMADMTSVIKSTGDRNRRSTVDVKPVKETEMMLDSVASSLEAIYGKSKEVSELLTKVADNDTPEVATRRGKRGLIDFGGKLLGKLFGLGTEDDVRAIRLALKTLERNQFQLATSISTYDNEMVAAVKSTNTHVQKLTKMMTVIEDKFDYIVDDLRQNVYRNTQYTSFAVSLITALLQDLMQANIEVTNFVTGLRYLLREKLSVALIQEHTLESALKELDQHIVDRHKTFRVAEKEAAYYYKYSRPSYAWKDGNLIIHLSVPLTSTETQFKLFQVHTFHVPMNDTSQLATRVQLENEIFGLSEDKSRFLEMSRLDFMQCTRSRTIRCTQSVIMRDTFHPSCVLSLFQGDTERIKSLCTFRLEKVKEKVGLYPVTPGKLLVSYAHKISIGCPSRALVIREGCRFCIIAQPCACRITASGRDGQGLSLPPNLHECDGTTDYRYRVRFPVNLAILQKLANPTEIENIQANTYLTDILNVQTPTVRISKVTEGLDMNAEYDFSLDLDKAIEQIERNKTLNPLNLQALDEGLDYNEGGLFDGLPSLKEIFMMIGAIVILICMIICIRKCIKCYCKRRRNRTRERQSVEFKEFMMSTNKPRGSGTLASIFEPREQDYEMTSSSTQTPKGKRKTSFKKDIDSESIGQGTPGSIRRTVSVDKQLDGDQEGIVTPRSKKRVAIHVESNEDLTMIEEEGELV